MARYEQRRITAHDISASSGIEFKAYSITADGRTRIDLGSILDNASSLLAGSGIPAIEHRRLGYLIYHAGEDAHWLIIRAWVAGDIVSGLLARIDSHGRARKVNTLIECVWEEIVVHHERNAWVRHMMTGSESPNGYLGDTLPNGWY